jgi:hypothetical protein
MRTFYTESDIEDLLASGVRQLQIGPEVVLTDAARQLAEELGIVLILPDAPPTGKVSAPIPFARNEALPAKPRGCQRGPLPASSSHAQTNGSAGRVVDQLVEAVSALKKQGG